jgi:hypothetical protein
MSKNENNKNSKNEGKALKPKRVYKLRIYNDDEQPFEKILNAVNEGATKMEPGKKYTLRKIVELSDPNLWHTLSYYTRRCMGASFATKYYKEEIYTVKMVDPDQSPIRYLKD